MEKFDISKCKRGVIIGASSGIASALIDQLAREYPSLELLTPARSKGEWLDESWWRDFAENYDEIDFFINAVGVLGKDEGPEKSVNDIDLDQIRFVMEVNCYISLLAMKYLKKKLTKKRAALFCVLSAKVGSIEDNRLGGWYSYRFSKSALNMSLKTFSLETKMSHPKLICIAQHPGTTKTDLTKNYIKNVKYKVKEPHETADILLNLWGSLEAKDSGSFYNWDGAIIPW